MKIAISADHRGYEIVRRLTQLLPHQGHRVVNFIEGMNGTSCDYPDRAYPAARAVADGEADCGILVCGTGIGMSIAANKVPGVRAALVHDELSAELSRRHNNANILCLPADMLGADAIERIVQTWLNTEFEGGRHERRVSKITAIETGRNPADVPASPTAAV